DAGGFGPPAARRGFRRQVMQSDENGGKPRLDEGGTRRPCSSDSWAEATILSLTNWPAIPEEVDPPDGETRDGGVHRWRSKQALDSAPTRSWDGSARGVWARSTALATPGSTAK